MAKSIIIKQLANNEISLEIALSHLLVIINSLDDKDLVAWCEHELNGYSKDDDLPSYRILDIHKGQVTYTGLNGNFQVSNVPLPMNVFTSEERNRLGATVNQSIKSIERASEKGEFSRDLTWFAPEVYERTEINCISITLKYPSTVFFDILSSVRTKLLNAFLYLDRVFGCLDELDIDISMKSEYEKDQLHIGIHNLILGIDE